MNKQPLTKSQIIKLLNKISIKSLNSEKLDLYKSYGRILFSHIISKVNIPPFKNSAVDGYALHTKDINNKKELKCSYRIAAGDPKKILLKQGEVARIFTGACMPKNSNTIVMQENAIVNKNGNIFLKKFPKQGENCRLSGEDVFVGKKILNKGDEINATNLNLIAAIGKSKINVFTKLRVGYFTSGNELKEPTENLKYGEINNSNHYSLFSLLNKNYIQSRYLGILPDNRKKIITILKNNIDNHDIIITTGGASVGDEDYLINVIKELGKVFFWKTAIKPGRPLAIGKIKKTLIICFPGNPVSVHLLFGMIIKPFIKKLFGSKFYEPNCLKASVNFKMKKKTKRLEWIRVTIDKNKSDIISVNKYPKQGSGMISSISFSDGVIEIPENVNQINKGDVYDLYLFKDLFN